MPLKENLTHITSFSSQLKFVNNAGTNVSMLYTIYIDDVTNQGNVCNQTGKWCCKIFADFIKPRLH